MQKDLKAIRGQYYIHRLIEEGEHEHQDFKFQISDARKIAHSLSAFSNNDGGRLLVGVKDNGVVAGLRDDGDIYMIEHAAERYCNPAVEIEVTPFRCENGLTVLRVEVPRAQRPPVMSETAPGKWAAYYRVKDENIVAPDIMVRAWRRAAESDGELLNLSGPESDFLRHLDANGPATPEEYMLKAHLSRTAAEEIIVRLAATGVVSFVFSGSSFRIALNSGDQKQ